MATFFFLVFSCFVIVYFIFKSLLIIFLMRETQSLLFTNWNPAQVNPIVINHSDLYHFLFLLLDFLNLIIRVAFIRTICWESVIYAEMDPRTFVALHQIDCRGQRNLPVVNKTGKCQTKWYLFYSFSKWLLDLKHSLSG